MRSSSKPKADKSKSKPYDRPEAKSSAKGKGKATEPTPSTPKATVNIGAPSAKQSSRKGKKAWRKNVDITAEETALESARVEERITGKVGEKKDGELFTIDTTGDAEGELLQRV